jgi:hypothetical protein
MSESSLPVKPRPRLRRRNELIRAATRRLRAVAPHIDDPLYVPVARDFCRLDFFIDRAFAELYDKPPHQSRNRRATIVTRLTQEDDRYAR